MALSSTTELDAVNTMLSAVGEPPVANLLGQTNADAAIAQNILTEISREVQSMGWHFNTQTEVTFSPDVNGEINLAGDIVRVDVDPRVKRTGVSNSLVNNDDRDITQRGTRLFDRTNNTFIFSKDVVVSVIYLFDFTELPEAARRYITVRAARIFQDRMVGSQKHHSFAQRDEMRALALLKEFEMDTSDPTIFDNVDTLRIINRGTAQRGLY